jgi:hypothetical protein
VRREARTPDAPPVSRGGALAQLALGGDRGASVGPPSEALLGAAATEDPLLLGARSVKPEERAHWHAKSTLVKAPSPRAFLLGSE